MVQTHISEKNLKFEEFIEFKRHGRITLFLH
jgi:hypothetical protein